MTGKAWPLVVVASALAPSGCAVITDLDVKGYRLADAGQPGDGACIGDAPCVSLGCIAAANCAAGEVCCLTLTPTSSFSLGCQSGACTAPPGIQLCKTDAECPSGGPCAPQQCSFGGPPLTLAACNQLPGCSPLP